MRAKAGIPSLLMLLLLCSGGSVAARGGDDARVAVVDLRFEGDASEGVRRELASRLAAGLVATGLRVVPEEDVRRALGTHHGRCLDAGCRRLAARRLGCRFIAGGGVREEDRSYAIELYLADGRSGVELARVRQRCDICGLKAVAERMDLAASALRAKLEALRRAPARVTVRAVPAAATVRVDGRAVGQAPQQLDLPAGRHRITVEAPGHLAATRTISAVAGVEERLTIELIPAAPPPSPRRTLGWLAVGAAVASVGVAAALFAVDGQPSGCADEQDVPGGQCPELLDTRAGAWSTAAVGIGFGLVGAYLLLWGDTPKDARRQAEVGLPLRQRF
jgi:hypothetical protein